MNAGPLSSPCPDPDYHLAGEEKKIGLCNNFSSLARPNAGDEQITGGESPNADITPSSVSRSDHTRVCASTRGEPTIPARGVPAWDPPGSPLDPARDPTVARPKCKSRSAPYRIPHGSRRKTDRAPNGSLTETDRQRDQTFVNFK
ncbi:hypothetical protein Bbelb_361440 [Branchiostoma belcheri]|nr:hypothetical protein Bbelb_361440 [Branchiostoma belcheri]